MVRVPHRASRTLGWGGRDLGCREKKALRAEGVEELTSSWEFSKAGVCPRAGLGERGWSGGKEDARRIKGCMVSKGQYLIIYSVDKNSYPVIHNYLECRAVSFHL